MLTGPSAVNQFKAAFLAASSAQRFQMITDVTNKNSDDTRIGNLVGGLNVNDNGKDPKTKNRADNIHCVCTQLYAFPLFKY
jgi:hypothetical protein